MNRSFLSLSLLSLTVVASAQASLLDTPQRLAFVQTAPQKRTIDVKQESDGSYSGIILFDGHKGLGGIAFTPTGGRGNLTFGALAVTDVTGNSLYVGALARYRLFKKGGAVVGLDLGGKGLDVTQLDFKDPTKLFAGRQFVIGLDVKVKF